MGPISTYLAHRLTCLAYGATTDVRRGHTHGT